MSIPLRQRLIDYVAGLDLEDVPTAAICLLDHDRMLLPIPEAARAFRHADYIGGGIEYLENRLHDIPLGDSATVADLTEATAIYEQLFIL